MIKVQVTTTLSLIQDGEVIESNIIDEQVFNSVAEALGYEIKQRQTAQKKIEKDDRTARIEAENARNAKASKEKVVSHHEDIQRQARELLSEYDGDGDAAVDIKEPQRDMEEAVATQEEDNPFSDEDEALFEASRKTMYSGKDEGFDFGF